MTDSSLPATRPNLLVSVRDVPEARLALSAGVLFIDVKEPGRGPLGAADAGLLWEVVRLRRDRCVTVSAALGELRDQPQPDRSRIVPGVELYKLGLSRCGDDWRDRLAEWDAELYRAGSRLVPSAYADAAAAGSPPPEQILKLAQRLESPYVLLDTFEKRTGSLRSHLGDTELREFIDTAHRAGVRVALAGSIRADDIGPVARLGPDVIGVRRAACTRGERTAAIDAERIGRLDAALVAATAP